MNITPELTPKNRYELDQMAEGFAALVESYPSFNRTKLLDEWREAEYSRLDANGQIYLDYTGGGLYSESQLCEHMELLRTSVLGNPHSANPTSLAMTDLVEGTRKYVLRYFSAIGKRVHCLTGWLLDNLLSLQHSNGKPMVRIYGPADTEMRGGTVTLNFYGPDERLLDYRRIEELANKEGISLRTGCFCNPGAGEIAEGLTTEDMIAGFNNGPDLSLPHFVQVIQHRGNKSAGAIRISVGLATNFADVYRFMHFAAGFRDKTNMNIGEVTFDIQSCRVIRDGS